MSLESEASKVKMIISLGTCSDNAKMSYVILINMKYNRPTVLCTCDFKISFRSVCIVAKSD